MSRTAFPEEVRRYPIAFLGLYSRGNVHPAPGTTIEVQQLYVRKQGIPDLHVLPEAAGPRKAATMLSVAALWGWLGPSFFEELGAIEPLFG